MPPLALRIVDRFQDLSDVDFATFGDREIAVWDLASGKVVGGAASLSSAGKLTAVGADLTDALQLILTDALTTTRNTGLTLRHNSSGTPGTGFGTETRWQLKSSTTADQDAAAVQVTWATATHGSRKARMALGVYDTAFREGLRIDTSGSLARVTLGDGATSGTARLYVRDDSNIELATFENQSGPASVFLKLGDNNTGAALRIYPGINATSGATLIGTGGLLLRGRYWTGSASADVDGQWALRMLTTAPTYAMVATVGSFDGLFVDQAGRVTVGTANLTTGLFNVLLSDSATATSSVLNCFNHRSTGTPAAGFGGETRWRLHSSTTTDQDAASVNVTWATATHASRKAQVSWSVYDTAAREALRLVTDGSTAQVLVAAGTVALPGLAPIGDADSGLYSLAANVLGIATGGVERMRFESTGMVGINCAPGATLSVKAYPAVANVFQIFDENDNDRFRVASTGNTFWDAVPATSGVTTQASAVLAFRTAYWNGSSSVQEGLQLQAIRHSTTPGAFTIQFQDGAGVVNLSYSGKGGQVCVGYDLAFDLFLSSLGQFHVRSVVATTPTITARGAASQSANLQEWQKSDTTIYSTVSENGYFTTRKVAAPADGELVASELAFWLDDTNGACKAMFKAKQADGTVRTGSVALA